MILIPYRYLIWLLHNAPGLSQTDATCAEYFPNECAQENSKTIIEIPPSDRESGGTHPRLRQLSLGRHDYPAELDLHTIYLGGNVEKNTYDQEFLPIAGEPRTSRISLI